MTNLCKIIAYHYVRPIRESQYSEIKGRELSDFKKQIEFLKKKFTFINSKELVESIYLEKEIPKNSILLTFDDGLKEHYTHVFPILKKHKIQGLFFPTAKPIIEKMVLNVHKIHFILAVCKEKKRIVNDIFSFIKNYKEKFNLKSSEQYFEEFAIANRFDSKETIFIKRMLQKGFPQHVRDKLINELFEKYVQQNELKFSENLYLSYDNIKEMQDEGMSFGSHTYTHNWLSEMKNKELKEEIEKSKIFLKKISNKNNDMIMCYPHGDFNEEVIAELKKSGFVAGMTIDVGDVIIEKKEVFSIKRYDTNDFPIN